MEEELVKLKELKTKLSPIQKKLEDLKNDFDNLLSDNSNPERDLNDLVEILDWYKKHYPDLNICLDTPKFSAEDRLGNCMIYLGMDGSLVLDAE